MRQDAEITGFSRLSINRAVIRFQLTCIYDRRPGSGRRRVTSAREDRFIAYLSLRNRCSTYFEVSNKLWRAQGVDVSTWTVRRRVQEKGLVAFRPDTDPRLTARHRQTSSRFATNQINWTSGAEYCSLMSPDGFLDHPMDEMIYLSIFL